MSVVNQPQAKTSARPRMYHVDLLRVLTFTCVVFVHSYGAMNPAGTSDGGAVDLLMHYTRYSFVFITAFVLFHSYYRKDTKATTFWRRRFGAVLLPYVVWTLIYTAVGFITGGWPGLDIVARGTAFNLLFGTGWFHLYFLLVSMQLYLLFPALRWLVRRTEGHHGKLLLASAVLQVAVFCFFTYVPKPENAVGAKLWSLQQSMSPTYVLFCALGALLAVHYQRVHAFVSRNLALAWPLFGIGLAVTLGVYLSRVAGGTPPGAAASPTHPDMLPWALGCILALYALCTWWAARRREGTFLARVVDLGSVRAFGVYAVHPLMIHIQWVPLHEQFLELFGGNRWVAGFAMFATTVVLSVLLVEVLLRSPWAKALVARSPLRRTPVAAAA